MKYEIKFSENTSKLIKLLSKALETTPTEFLDTLVISYAKEKVNEAEPK